MKQVLVRLVVVVATITFLSISAEAKSQEYNIYFGNDKHNLTVIAKGVLDKVAKVLKANPAANAILEGHASAPASVSHNKALSKKRSVSARNYLVKNHGISYRKLSVSNYGEGKPVSKLERKNRRVRIIIVLDDEMDNVFTSVVDKNGNFIKGLGKTDFTVIQNGQPREIVGVVFESEELGSEVALVLDKSGSMKADIDNLREAARTFISSKKKQDQIMVVGFSSMVRVYSDFSADNKDLSRAVGGLTASGNTVLYDAIHTSATRMSKRLGSRYLVLMTDGVDEGGIFSSGSKYSLSDAIAALKANNITAYTIGLGSKIDKKILNRIADKTGGAAYFTTSSKQLKSLYKKISSGVLKGKYKITYKTDTANEKTNVSVKSKRGKVTGVRTN